MRERYGGSVIAVDVSPKKEVTINLEEIPSSWDILWSRISPFKKSIKIPTIFDILMRTTMLSSIHKMEEMKTDADLYLHPEVDQFGLLEFRAIDEIVEIGYQHTKKKIEKWKSENKIKSDSILTT